MTAEKARKALHNMANVEKALGLQKFFKTAPGQYGYGDQFIGVVIPHIRQIAKEFKHLDLNQLQKLLSSKIHEERMLALLILVLQFSKADIETKEAIYEFYLKNVQYVNNWDLVDQSAYYIVGAFLKDDQRDQLYKWVASSNMWERRIAIVATMAYIRKNDFKDTLLISGMLLNDREDLIHKAVGWLLREVGKRDESVLELFLEKHCLKMPRTTLRYAIERLPLERRQDYLKRR